MRRLIRTQTAHGDTIIEFLDDVMQDRTEGFKTYHRLAAARELLVHILRDEHDPHTPSPSLTPSPSTGEGWGEGDPPVVPVQAEGNPDNTIVVPAEAGTQGGSGGRTTIANPARTEPNAVVPAQAGTQGDGGAHTTTANSAHPEPVLSTVEGPNSPVVPEKSGTQGSGGGRTTVATPAHTEPALSTVEGSEPVEGSQPETNNSKLETLPRRRRTRTQRRRYGNARAAILRQRPERNKREKRAPVELTIAERRIKEKLDQHWHDPDPYGAPIDSTHHGRSPPR